MKTYDQYTEAERNVHAERINQREEQSTVAKLGKLMSDQERADYMLNYKKIRAATELMGAIALKSPRHNRRRGIINADGTRIGVRNHNDVHVTLDEDDKVSVGDRPMYVVDHLRPQGYIVAKGENTTTFYQPRLDGVLITRTDNSTEKTVSETVVQSYEFADKVTSKIINTLHEVAMQTHAEDRAYEDARIDLLKAKLQ